MRNRDLSEDYERLSDPDNYNNFMLSTLESKLKSYENAFQWFGQLGKTLPDIQGRYGIEAQYMIAYFSQYIYTAAEYAERQERKALKLLKNMPTPEQAAEMGEHALQRRDEFFQTCEDTLNAYRRLLSIVSSISAVGGGQQYEPALNEWSKWGAGHIAQVLDAMLKMAQVLNLDDVVQKFSENAADAAEQTKPIVKNGYLDERPPIKGWKGWTGEAVGNYILPTVEQVPKGFVSLQKAARTALDAGIAHCTLYKKEEGYTKIWFPTGGWTGPGSMWIRTSEYALALTEPVEMHKVFGAGNYLSAMLDEACKGKLEVVRAIGTPSVYVSKESLKTFIDGLTPRHSLYTLKP